MASGPRANIGSTVIGSVRAFIAVLLLLAVSLALLLGSCDRARPPVPPSSGPRLVVLSPALAATLQDLGLADLIVGRHAWDLVLDKSIPVCGDQSGIDYEALLTARPTDVLLQWGARPLPQRLVELAAANHWTVRNREVLTLGDVRSAAAELGSLYAPSKVDLSGPGRGASTTTAAVLDHLDRSWSKRPEDLSRAGRVLLLLSASPPAALGPGSFHHEILSAIGGTPAVTNGAPYIEYDAEDVLNLRPDTIVLIIPRAPNQPPAPSPSGETLDHLLGPLGKLDIPAVRAGRVFLLDDPLALLPSTSMARFADDLARALASCASDAATSPPPLPPSSTGLPPSPSGRGPG